MRHAVRTRSLDAEPSDLVRLIVGEVSLVPKPLGRVLFVTLPRQNVGRDPIKEPAVVGDHHSTPRKFQQRILQRLRVSTSRSLVGSSSSSRLPPIFSVRSQVQPVTLTAG